MLFSQLSCLFVVSAYTVLANSPRTDSLANVLQFVPFASMYLLLLARTIFLSLCIYCFGVGLCQLRLGVLPVNNSLHRYSACASQRKMFCVNAIGNEEGLLFACPLYNDIRDKLLNDTSQNAVTASLETVLSWKSKTNMFRLAKFVFNMIRKRKEFTGSN